MITLLFSWDYQLLGEFLFEEGACVRMTWTAYGASSYVSIADEWQTLGIQTLALVQKGQGDEEERFWLHQRTTLKSPNAEHAFLRWASEKGAIVSVLPERLIPYWEKLCRLELEPQERFASLQSMRTASHTALEAWDGALDQIITQTKTK